MATAFSCCCQSAIGVILTTFTVEKGIVENEAEGLISPLKRGGCATVHSSERRMRRRRMK